MYLNSIQIHLSCIEFKFRYANSFNMKLLKWNLIFTKPTHFFHQFMVTSSAQQCGEQIKIEIGIINDELLLRITKFGNIC
jgi:hypothetical protein